MRKMFYLTIGLIVIFAGCSTSYYYSQKGLNKKDSITKPERSLIGYTNSLEDYAKATVRYFTSDEANNKEVGFTHAFYGTGKFQVYRDGAWVEEGWDLTRGYGSHVNINEITLRFLSLAAAYKMDWLTYLQDNKRYEESWGQVLLGLQTLRCMQTSNNDMQFYNGHFHRTYLTTIDRNYVQDLDRHNYEIVRPDNENIQSTEDNALPYMNLLVLEGLANDQSVNIPDRNEIIDLCREIRNNINLDSFVIDNKIVFNFENGSPSTGIWDRLSAEGSIILGALLISGQITLDEFCSISNSLENYPVNWSSNTSGQISINKPSYHSAMFSHGLRTIHGMPVVNEEHPGLNYFDTSIKPITKAHIDYAEHNGFKALGTQVMTQALFGIPMLEMNGVQVQFPGNEDNIMPCYGSTLSRGTGPHAFFVSLSRSQYLDQYDIDKILYYASEYENDFFHNGTDIDRELGWEAIIPWTPNDKTYAWQASDSTWKYSDWGRPYEALNSAYIILSIFDALNQNAPLASYNIEEEKVKDVAFYLDNGMSFNPDIFWEAEDYSSGSCVREGYYENASNDTYLDAGGYYIPPIFYPEDSEVTYTIDLDYTITNGVFEMLYSDDVAGNMITVYLDDNFITQFGSVDTGSWDNFLWHQNGNLGTISKGTHTIKIEISGGSWGIKLDAFKIKCDSIIFPPVISSFTPTEGIINTVVNITGSNLTGATSVKFGSTNAKSFINNSSTQITAVVDNGSTGQITVTTPGGTTISTQTFTYIPVEVENLELMNMTINTDTDYSCSGYIYAKSFIIQNGANVTFWADNMNYGMDYIKLDTGFKVELGSTFKANIGN